MADSTLHIAAVVPILPPVFAFTVFLWVLFVSVTASLMAWRRPAVAKRGLRVVWRCKGALLCLALLLSAGGWGAYRLAAFFSGSPPGTHASSDKSNTTTNNSPENHSLNSHAQTRFWPTSRGSVLRLGARPASEGPFQGGLVWSYSRTDAFYASPALWRNYVLAVGCRGDAARIDALDLATGERAWTISDWGAPPRFRATFSSPVVADGFLLCGEGLHHTQDARVSCFDLRPKQPRLAWSFRTKSHVECTPAVHRGRVFFGAGDDGFYCLRLVPEKSLAAQHSSQPKPRQPEVLWRLSADDYPDAETALAVHEDRVYLGLGKGGRALCVLEAATGKEIRRIEAPHPIFSPPLIRQGKLYVGMGGGDYVDPQRARRGAVWRIDLKTLEVDWKFTTPGTVLGACAAVDDRVVFGCADGVVYALDRQGRPVERFDTGAPIVTSPAVSQKRIYVVNTAGLLLGLDRRWLTPVWQHYLPRPAADKGLFLSSPVVAGGRVYVGTQNGFHCVGSPPDLAYEEDDSIWPGPFGGAGLAGCRDQSAIPRKGSIAWKYSPDPKATVVAPAAAVKGAIVVPIAGEGKTGVACLDASPAASAPLRWFGETNRVVWQSPVVALSSSNQRQVLAVDGRIGESDRFITCWRLDGRLAGKRLWRKPVASSASGVLAASGRFVLASDQPGELSCYRLDGSLIWKRSLGDIRQPMHAGQKHNGSRLVVVAENPPRLWMLDLPTGKTLWRVDLSQPAGAAPVVWKDRIYLDTEGGIEVRSLLDGQRVFRGVARFRRLGAAASPLFIDEEHFALVNQQGEFLFGRREDGVVLKRRPGVLPGAPPLITSAAALLWTEQGIVRLSLADGVFTEELYFPATAEQGWAGPMILQNGNVYWSANQQGMVCISRSQALPGNALLGGSASF